ncbi:MAG: hypothetical protein L3J19_07010 [Sulfurimonas sp.]|nr:hypothetical protein [Sulfurimonas sp.]
MKKLIFLSLLATLALAQNPRVYSALGDVMYDNVEKIEKLKNIAEFSILQSKIDKYVEDVRNTKKDGFSIESKNIDKSEYLTKLRKLSKTNDFFVRDVKKYFIESIEIQDNRLFTATVNSGLLDTKAHKQEIINYYLKHSDDLDASGVIQSFLDENSAIKKRTKANKDINKNIEISKIKRIRQRDKRLEEAVRKSLEEELIQKKNKIRQYQKKELSED